MRFVPKSDKMVTSRQQQKAMTPTDESQPSAEFTAQVAKALHRLYDPSGLLRGPLVDWLFPAEAGNASPERRSRLLRALLLETIESLRPSGDVSFRSLAARSYQALRLHYVEGRTVHEVAHHLALSPRQAYRDIHKGEADLALLLWQRRPRPVPEPLQSAGRVLRQEVERLPLSPSSVSLRDTLRQVGAALAQLAQQTARPLPTDLRQDLQVRADPLGLRQCLTAMLSYALQASTGELDMTAEVEQGNAVLRLLARGAQPGGVGGLANLLAVARTLAEAVGGRLQGGPDGPQLRLELQLPLKPASTIVVIDDNEGLPQLFQRYLGGGDCTVLGASDASEGLRLARHQSPSAIVLDILMPGTDGWSLLTALKADPATANVPVIVCSVFNDPQLAYSLGAAACLSKPVSPGQLLQVLAKLGINS